MTNAVEVVRPPEAEKEAVELVKKRDAKLVKRAIGKQATDSLKARSVKEALDKQNINKGVELDKNQLETVQKALGALATEKGITKLPQRFRSRRLNRKIGYARKELG